MSSVKKQILRNMAHRNMALLGIHEPNKRQFVNGTQLSSFFSKNWREYVKLEKNIKQLFYSKRKGKKSNGT